MALSQKVEYMRLGNDDLHGNVDEGTVQHRHHPRKPLGWVYYFSCFLFGSVCGALLLSLVQYRASHNTASSIPQRRLQELLHSKLDFHDFRPQREMTVLDLILRAMTVPVETSVFEPNDILGESLNHRIP